MNALYIEMAKLRNQYKDTIQYIQQEATCIEATYIETTYIEATYIESTHPNFTPPSLEEDKKIPLPNGSFVETSNSKGKGIRIVMEGGGPGDDDLHYDPSIIKPHLPLVQPCTYKGERKDNACKQWCIDIYNFIYCFKILTRKYLCLVQAIEYIS